MNGKAVLVTAGLFLAKTALYSSYFALGYPDDMREYRELIINQFLQK